MSYMGLEFSMQFLFLLVAFGQGVKAKSFLMWCVENRSSAELTAMLVNITKYKFKS